MGRFGRNGLALPQSLIGHVAKAKHGRQEKQYRTSIAGVKSQKQRGGRINCQRQLNSQHAAGGQPIAGGGAFGRADKDDVTAEQPPAYSPGVVGGDTEGDQEKGRQTTQSAPPIGVECLLGQDE